MKAKKELATELRKLACLFRESVKEQNLKVLARKLDLLLPARAARILCSAFDGGILGSDASWDLRDLSLTPEEIESEQADLQEQIARLDVHFNDVRAIALRRREIEDDREVLKNKAALDDDLAHACTWWKYIESIWESERLRFPVDIEQHFILEDGDNSGKHIYSPYDDKQTRIRLRLDSSANAQATACEILADRIELPDPDAAPETLDADSGEVTNPSNPSDFVSMNAIVNDHTPTKQNLNQRRLRRTLDDYPQFKIRWMRPLASNGKPRVNRRSVHLLDWENYLRNTSDENPDGTDFVGPDEKEFRQALIRLGKENGGR